MVVKTPQISGTVLVADFQSALISLQTSDVASAEARRSEAAVVSELTALSDRSYLQPGTIDKTTQQNVSRASINAHVMKVQAQQLQQLGHRQIAELQVKHSSQYVGKKVQITAVNSTSESPFDVVWFNSQGGYRSNVLKKRVVRGTISEIVLDKNLLVVTPKRLPRLLNRDLDAYLVYVIDPLTMQPAVTVDLG